MQQKGSLMAVFDAICVSGEVSRAAIADMTGFSLMSVGKAVDKLLSSGIVTEKKLTGGGVGRKSGAIALEKSRGMILFDFTDLPRVRACDIENNILTEREGEDVGELMLFAMNALFEAGCSEIMGTVAIVPREKENEARQALDGAIGELPVTLISPSRAAAYANSKRFDFSKMAMFFTVDAYGHIDGAIMLGDGVYTGAHGRAGDFPMFCLTRNAFADKLADICFITDPELIHVCCECDSDVEHIKSVLSAALCERGFTEDTAINVIVEPSGECRGALDGAAFILREKYVLAKIPNNT